MQSKLSRISAIPGNRGINRILGRSEETHKLQYAEYYGDGDRAMHNYNDIEDAYENIHGKQLKR